MTVFSYELVGVLGNSVTDFIEVLRPVFRKGENRYYYADKEFSVSSNDLRRFNHTDLDYVRFLGVDRSAVETISYDDSTKLVLISVPVSAFEAFRLVLGDVFDLSDELNKISHSGKACVLGPSHYLYLVDFDKLVALLSSFNLVELFVQAANTWFYSSGEVALGRFKAVNTVAYLTMSVRGSFAERALLNAATELVFTDGVANERFRALAFGSRFITCDDWTSVDEFERLAFGLYEKAIGK